MSEKIQKHTKPPNRSYGGDEIDLSEILSTLWKRKWIISTIIFIFSLASVAVAIYLPNEYKSTAIVMPNDGGAGGQLSSLSGQIGGLASLAGINLGSSNSSEPVIALEIMKSWGFAENFINKYNIAAPLFAAKDWSQSTDKLIFDDELYDATQKKWISARQEGRSVKPTSWELYESLKNRLFISQDKKTGLIKISVTHYSPQIAKEWTDLLILEINEQMKQRALKESNKSIQYLEAQINQTSVAEIRTIFSELIQEQHKTKMLAQVSDEFVFKTIAAAKVPEKKDKPRRFFIVLVGAFLGFIFSVFIVFILDLMKRDI